MARAPRANKDVFMIHQQVKSAWEQSSSFNQSSNSLLFVAIYVVVRHLSRSLLLTPETCFCRSWLVTAKVDWPEGALFWNPFGTAPPEGPLGYHFTTKVGLGSFLCPRRFFYRFIDAESTVSTSLKPKTARRTGSMPVNPLSDRTVTLPNVHIKTSSVRALMQTDNIGKPSTAITTECSIMQRSNTLTKLPWKLAKLPCAAALKKHGKQYDC
jgi:hypothetical protein